MKQFNSTTRTVLLAITLNICALTAITIFLDYEKFQLIFGLFSTFTGAVAYHFFQKSTADAKSNTVNTTISQESKPLQTPEKGA